MSLIVPEGTKLSLLGKFSRLSQRMREPEWRRHFKLVFFGKFLGLSLLLLGMVAFTYWRTSTTARADTPATTQAVATTEPAATTQPAAVDQGGRHHQSHQHRLDARRRVPGVLHAGRLHHAGGRLL